MQTMITVENLSYTYPKTASPAVKGISFKVNDGEILGFLGPSGAGKSTTQKVLIGL
jgi:fluoroquinolone transport system ATP-binding protein